MRRLNIMIYVAYALEYLLHHGYLKPVVHCDASNVLLDGNLVAHLSDFGIAKIFGDRESIAYTKTLATMGYIAPGEASLLSFNNFSRTKLIVWIF